LIRAFRERLIQAARTLRHGNPAARLVLVLDAIDHAALQAGATGSQSFAHLLLQSLSISPVEGLAVVASCRTERRDQARGGALCRLFEIPVFSSGETRRVVLMREPSATDAEVAALHTRSGGDPRCLDALLRTGRPFDPPAPGTGAGPLTTGDALDALIRQEIATAEHRALERGATEQDIRALLVGLALLPPPVPVGELAAAQGLSEAVVESFATDLHPLLDRTPHGLIFRDEPTETVIHSIMQADPAARETVIQRLTDRQTISTYAARALPAVLTSLARTDELVQLAFDDRLPRSATSRVAKRGIRLARLGIDAK
jgi:hypothetical protein